VKNLFMAQEMRFFGPSASLRASFLSPQNDSPRFQQSKSNLKHGFRYPKVSRTQQNRIRRFVRSFLWYSCCQDSIISCMWQVHVSPSMTRRTKFFGGTAEKQSERLHSQERFGILLDMRLSGVAEQL